MSVSQIVLVSRIVVTLSLAIAIATTATAIAAHNADLAVAGGVGISFLKVVNYGAWTVTR